MKYTTFQLSIIPFYFSMRIYTQGKKKTKLPFLKSYTISNLSKKNQNLTS